MAFRISSFLTCLKSGFAYLPVTAELAIVSLAVGIVLGLIIAVVRVFRFPVVSQILAAFVTVYQGIPFVVALLIYNLIYAACFNDFAAFFHLGVTVADMNIIVVGYFALILQQTVNVSDTFRGALMSIPKTQFEAGYSVGLTRFQTLRQIVLPQMLPVSIPGLINNMVGAIKATSLVSAIGIMEVLNGSLIPCGYTYSYVEGYVAAAAVYWVFSAAAEFLARKLESFSGGFRKQPVR